MAVYFVRTHTGSIKIGSAVNLLSRLQGLKHYYGHSVELIKAVEGGKLEEREFHRRFRAYRLGGRRALTEQFQPGPDLAAFLGIPLPPGYRNIEIAVPVETDGYYRDAEQSVSELPVGTALFMGLPTGPWGCIHAVEATAGEAVKELRKPAICGISVALRPIPWTDRPVSRGRLCSYCEFTANRRTSAGVGLAHNENT